MANYAFILLRLKSIKPITGNKTSISSGSPSNLIELVFIFGDVAENMEDAWKVNSIIGMRYQKR